MTINSINFADRLILAIKAKGNPCIVGLDPRLDLFPEFVFDRFRNNTDDEIVINAITYFNTLILDQVKDVVVAVKPQIAFYEQYGIPGLIAFQNTVEEAKKRNLIVIVDAKRNDIGSTAEAYSNAFLGKTNIQGKLKAMFDVDAITINPYLGFETLVPFIETCNEFGKGLFVLVKTSNPGSSDIQDKILAGGNKKVYIEIAEVVHKMGKKLIGNEGYSSMGAVVGATHPQAADELRNVMPNNFFLVPGYGAQGGKGKDIINCFNQDKLGAIINASRSITFSGYTKDVSMDEFNRVILLNTHSMINDINSVVA